MTGELWWWGRKYDNFIENNILILNCKVYSSTGKEHGYYKHKINDKIKKLIKIFSQKLRQN